jgi:hypothetical protein
MTLPIADHSAVAALPVLAPALIISVVLLVHYLKERRSWEDGPDAGSDPPGDS